MLLKAEKEKNSVSGNKKHTTGIDISLKFMGSPSLIEQVFEDLDKEK
jgi:hypothetical protein